MSIFRPDLTLGSGPPLRPGRVTVAIACCNQAQFLGDAIDSVLAQTRPVDEIIMVDDGSCDKTAQVTAAYPTVLYHFQENAGLSAARNTGIRLASGEFILFLDSDDVLMPTAIADALAVFERRPDIAFAYGGYREVTEFRELIFERMAEVHADPFEGLLRGNHVSMHGTVLYRAQLLRETGGFDVTLKSCEDYDVFLRLARRHPIDAYASIGADYRRHRNNMTGNHIRMMRTSRQVVQRHMADGPLTPAQRRAGVQGLDFMTGYYSQCALTEVAFCFRRARQLIWGCLVTDRKFVLRAFGHAAVSIGRKLRRRFTPKHPPLPPEEQMGAPVAPVPGNASQPTAPEAAG